MQTFLQKLQCLLGRQELKEIMHRLEKQRQNAVAQIGRETTRCGSPGSSPVESSYSTSKITGIYITGVYPNNHLQEFWFQLYLPSRSPGRLGFLSSSFLLLGRSAYLSNMFHHLVDQDGGISFSFQSLDLRMEQRFSKISCMELFFSLVALFR